MANSKSTFKDIVKKAAEAAANAARNTTQMQRGQQSQTPAIQTVQPQRNSTFAALVETAAKARKAVLNNPSVMSRTQPAPAVAPVQTKTFADFNSAQELYDYRLKNTAQNAEDNAVSKAIQADLDALTKRRKELERDAWYNTADEMEAINAQYSPEEAVYSPEQIAAAREREKLPSYENDLRTIYYQQLEDERIAALNKVLAPYQSLRSNADFEQVVIDAASKEQPKYEPEKSLGSTLLDVKLGGAGTRIAAENFQNEVDNPALWAAANSADLLAADAKYSAAGKGLTDSRAGYLYMNDDEIQMYTYLLEAQGKKAAEEYYDIISDELSLRRQNSRYMSQAEWAKEHPWAASFASFGTSLMQPVGYVGNAVDYLVNGETDINSIWNAPAQLTSAFREGSTSNLYNDYNAYAQELANKEMRGEEVTQEELSKLEELEAAANVFSFLSNTGYSMGDNLTAMLLGGGGLGSAVLMGGEAAGATTYQSLRSGKTAEQALMDGGISALVESATEKWSLGNLKMLAASSGAITKQSVKTFIKELGKNMAKQGVAEASEEVVSEYANTIYDIIVNGENSEYNRYYVSLLMQGVPADEAEALTQKEFFFTRTGESGLSGGLSGVLFGAGGTFYGNAQSGRIGQLGANTAGSPAVAQAEAAAAVGMTAVEQNAANTLAGIAQRVQTGENTIADIVAEKVLTGEKVGNAELRQLQAAPAPVRRAFTDMTDIDIAGMDSSRMRAAIAAASKNATVTKEKAAQYFSVLGQEMQRTAENPATPVQSATAAQYDALNYNAPEVSAVGAIDAAREGGRPLEVASAPDVGDAAGIAEDFRQNKTKKASGISGSADLSRIKDIYTRMSVQGLDTALRDVGSKARIDTSGFGNSDVDDSREASRLWNRAALDVTDELKNTSQFIELQRQSKIESVSVEDLVSDTLYDMAMGELSSAGRNRAGLIKSGLAHESVKSARSRALDFVGNEEVREAARSLDKVLDQIKSKVSANTEILDKAATGNSHEILSAMHKSAARDVITEMADTQSLEELREEAKASEMTVRALVEDTLELAAEGHRSPENEQRLSIIRAGIREAQNNSGNRNPTEDADIWFRLTGNQYNAPALEYALEEGTLNDTQLSNLATQLREHGIDLSNNPDTQELLEAVDMLDNVEPGFELTISNQPAKAKQPPKPPAQRKRATPEEKQRKAAEAEQKKAAVAERRAVPPAPKKATKKAAKNATPKAPRQKSITSLAAEHKTGTAKVSGYNVNLTDPKAIARGLEGDAHAEFIRQIDAVNEFGKAFGHSVNYYYGRVGDSDSNSAGFYYNGKVYVNVNSLRAAGLKTVAHEICHDIAAHEPGFVNSFYRLYREYCESNGLMNEFNRRWNKVYNNSLYPDKQLAIAEEVLAEKFGEYAENDSGFLNYCMGKRPSIITRIVEAFNRLLTKLRLKKYSKAAADAMELRNYMLGVMAQHQLRRTGKGANLSAAVRADYRNAQRKAESIGDRYAVIADSGANLTEWDTTGLASPDEYKNLRKTAPNEITDYGFKKVVVGKKLRNVLIVNPTRYISEGYHADMVAASRSLAASLGIRLGFITGQTSQTDGKAGSRRDAVINSDFIMTDDDTLYINLDSEVPYTKIVAGAWWSKFRKSNPAAAANLERLAERSGKLTGDDRIAQEYAVGMLTRTNAQGVKALNLNPETLVEKLSDNKSAAYAFAHERPGIIRKLFENAGDMVAKLTGKQDYRAAYISGQLQARLMKAFSETDHNDPGAKISADKRKSVPDGVWFMYAGENARTADATALEQAKSMMDNGADPETVRQETGWFKGMDGKWRFEIDDSKAQYYRAGDARFSRTHADYARHQTLLNKMLNGQISPEEYAELRKLDEIWGRERGRLNERVDRGNATLDEILDHEALFEAYPELRNVKVRFDVMYDGKRGSYDRKSNTITLSSDLRDAPEDTLLHEIQHAVQAAEGFSPGGSIDSSSRAISEVMDILGLSAGERRVASIGLLSDYADSLSGDVREQLTELANSNGYDSIREYIQSLEPRTYYGNISGEIEARDTAARRLLTPEQRKNTRPDIDRKDVVFVDNSRYNEARTRRFFGNNTFPPFNTSHSEANEIATRWAHRQSVEVGDQALVSYHGRWYLVEKFNESELGYYIVDYVKKAEFNKIFEELKLYGKIIEGKSIIWGFNSLGATYRPGNRAESREPGSSYAAVEYRGESIQIQPVDRNENSGRSSGDNRGPGNGSGFEDKQGSGTERLSEENDIRFSARRDNNAALREPTRTERRSWLDDYADTYGQIPEGEAVNSRGDQRIPRRIDKETKTRQTYRTYAEALTTPDDFVGELEKEVVDGRASYTPLSNKAAAGYADSKIAEGMDEAMATWNAVTHGDVIADKNQIALGERLIMEAINNRDVKLFTRLVAEVAAEATRAGQMVQAISMVKRLSPEGQLMSFQKEVSKLNESLANRKGHPQITPDENLTQEYMDIASELEDVRKEISELEGTPENRRTERQQDAIDSLEAREKQLEQQLRDKKNEMITDAAEQIPPTWMDKLRAWRYLAMLGNPRTHIRNLLGNAVFIPAVRIKQGIAGTIERMAVKPGERTQGITASKELRDFAREDAKTQLDILSAGGKYNQTDAIAAEQKPFDDSKVIGKTLNKLADINSAALEGEDAFFLRRHYEFALSRFAAANKWTVEYLKRSPEALAKARGFAYREAQRATYRDLSSFAQLMSKVSKKLSKQRGLGKLGYMMFEGAMPFKKTPCNIMKRGIEYSPLGIASAISKGAIMLRDRRNGVESDYSGTEFINDLAAGMTGTMIMGLGYLMTSLGMLHGRDKDEEDEINAIQGVQEYSVIVGDHSYTVDWVTPVAFPLFVGSELYDQISADRDGYSMDDFYNSLSGIAEPLFSLSMMDGIQSMMQSYNSEGAVFEAGVSAAESYLGQYFPTLSGQLARTITPEVHFSSYRDKTDTMPDFASGVVQKAMAKIPGAYSELPEMIDVWGRNVGAGDTWYQRAAENFLSPGYLERIETTDADRLVSDLYKETGDPAVIPGAASKYFTLDGERYDMPPDEYVAYAKTRGKTSYGILSEFYGSEEFKRLTPEQRVSCVETAYKFATAIAKAQTNSGYVIDTKWQREAYDAFLAGETTLAQAIIDYKTK